MIIRTMKATFGTLAGDELKLDRGLNIIYAPNESGKSTWCAFLRAMLYGVDTAERARGGQLPAKTRYAPWSGAPMEGEITLEHEGKSITLRRTTPNEKAPNNGAIWIDFLDNANVTKATATLKDSARSRSFVDNKSSRSSS